MQALRELYQQVIIDHSRKPRHFGELADCSHQRLGHNPLCGDQITVYARCCDEVITALQFSGSGCAICMASASLMSEALQQKPISEARKMFDGFHAVVTGKEPPTEDLGKLAVLAGVAEYPVRVKCATLAWHTLLAALDSPPQSQPVSTE